MANRYWVGGTGNWSDATNHWATASNGSPGSGNLPTSSDNVFFDNNSAAGTFTVTIDTASAVCGAFDASGITNSARKMTLTGTTSVGVLTVNGNWTNPTSTYFAWTTWTLANIVFAANSTVVTNAVSFASQLSVNGSGITVTLGGAFTSTLLIALTNGNFDTSASNYAVTATGITIIANSNTRALNLNASSVTVSGTTSYTDSSTGGFTLNAGTSTITCSNASPTFAGGGKTFYNVTFSSTATGQITITGANTFNNLTFTSRAATGIKPITIGADMTVSGTLTIGASNTAVRRILIFSNTIGTQRTLTVATFASTTDVDFRDIQAAGSSVSSSNWNSAGTGRFGNAGGNGNKITFDTAKTVYWNLAAGGNWSDTAWATATGSGAAVNVNNFPLAQDTAIIQSDTATLGSGNTITLDNNYCFGTVDFSARTTNTMTFATGATITNGIYGDFNVGSGVTITTTSGALSFQKQGVQTFTYSPSTACAKSFTQNGPGGTVRINGNVTLDTASIFTLTSGTLDLTNNGAGNYTLSTGLFASNNSNTRAITFGTGSIAVTGNAGTIWSAATTTNLTYTGTPAVNFSYSGSTGTRTIRHSSTAGGASSTSLNFNITAGSDIIDLICYANNLDFTNFSGSLTVSSGSFLYGNLLISSGMTVNSSASGLTFSATSGTQQLTSNGKTVDFPITQNNSGATLQLQDNLTMGSTRTFTLTNGTLDLTKGGTANLTLSAGLFNSNNSNTRAITFGTGNITVTGSGTSIWQMSQAGGFTYTGTPTINFTYSGSTGTRIIAHGSTSGGTVSNAISVNITDGDDTITFQSSATNSLLNIDFTGFTGTLSNSTYSVYGNYKFVSGMTVTGGGNSITFGATSSTQQITSAGLTIDCPIIVGTGTSTNTLQLQDNLTLGATRTLTLTSGTLDLTKGGTANLTLSTGLFYSTNSNTRAITFGAGNITVTGTDATVVTVSTGTGLTYTGTSNIQITGSGTAGQTRILNGSSSLIGGTETNALNYTITNGADTIQFGGSVRVYNNVTFTSGFTGIFDPGGQYIYGNLTLATGGMTYASNASGVSFLASSGTQQLTTAGLTIDTPLTQNNSGATLRLEDNLTMGSTRTYTFTAGTLNVNGKTITASTFTNTGTSTRAITFNSGTISLSGSGSTVWNASGSGFTTSAGTGVGTISLTSASAKTFVGGGYTYAAKLNQGGAGTLTVTGSNTFSGLSNSSQPATITITAGTTQTFTGAVTLAGTSGNLITLNSDTPGTQYTFTYPTSTAVSSLSYCAISDCIGYQNAYWRAYQTSGNTNGGNNLGWIFAPLIYNAAGAQFTT